MKYCPDILHEGTNPLPVSDFYPHARRCKPCIRRSATADQKRRRNERKALGLPQKKTEQEKTAAETHASYADRSAFKRLLEYEQAEVLVAEPVEPNPFETERTFSTVIGALHRQPQRLTSNGIRKL
jgi:hypothetical protein